MATDLPTSAAITGSSTTNAEQKINFAAIRNFIANLLGTDSSDKAAARSALGAAASGANSDITSLTGITGIVKFAKGTNIASAATVNLSGADGNTVHITGTTATSAVTMGQGLWVECIADAAWPLNYHATNLKLNTGGANYTCSAGDRIFFFSDGTTVFANIVPQGGNAALSGSSAQTFSVAPASASAHAVNLGQFTSSRSGISVGSAAAATGTVSSSGWEKLPDGKIRQWVTIQLNDNVDAVWTYPVSFPNAATGIKGCNLAVYAGQVTGAARTNVLNLASALGLSSVSLRAYNSITSATPAWFYVEVEGY